MNETTEPEPEKVDYKSEAIKWKYFAESRVETLRVWGITECLAYSEVTISIPGWYFFYPKYPGTYDRPKFIEVDQDAIDDGDHQCRKYKGTYMGPVIPPSLPKA